MQIWKYDLVIDDRQTVEMPVGAKLLSVAVQPRPGTSGTPCLWAMVDPKQSMQQRTIAIYGTGNPIPENPGEFIGTVLMPPFVWHVFATR